MRPSALRQHAQGHCRERPLRLTGRLHEPFGIFCMTYHNEWSIIISAAKIRPSWVCSQAMLATGGVFARGAHVPHAPLGTICHW